MNVVQPDMFKTPKPANGFPPVTIELRVQGLVPGKKNNKMLVTKSPNGRPLEQPFLITKPEYQKVLEKVTESLRLQLLSACQTASGGTLTASFLQSWIASSVPADDAWTHIPEIHVKAELCEPGKEGITILIKRLN